MRDAYRDTQELSCVLFITYQTGWLWCIRCLLP